MVRMTRSLSNKNVLIVTFQRLSPRFVIRSNSSEMLNSVKSRYDWFWRYEIKLRIS